jgi:hypothetical protein
MMKQITLLVLSILSTALSFAQQAQWVVKPRYEAVSPFSEGVAAVREGGKWGYVSDAGEEILPPRYAAAYPFSEGMGVLADADHALLAIVDKSGKRIDIRENLKIDSRFALFSDGRLLVTDGKRWGYLNQSGTLEIACKYLSAQPFSEGLAAVLLSGYWYYIDAGGATKVRLNNKREVYWALGFSDGLALLLYRNGMGYIDADGREVDYKLPPLTPPSDAASYKGKTLVCREGELAFDARSRALSFVNAQGEIMEFMIPGQEPDAPEIRKAANGRVGAVAIMQQPTLNISLASDTLESVFGNPAALEYVIRNTSSVPLENLELKINGQALSAQPSIAPRSEHRLPLQLDKTNEEETETKELQLSVSEYGLTVGEDRRKVVLRDLPAIRIEIPDDYVVLRSGQASYQLNVQLVNLSSVALRGAVVSAGNQRRTVDIGGRESQRLQFSVPASMQTVQVVVKSPRTPAVTKSKRLSLRTEQTLPADTTSSGLSKQIITQ